LSSRTKPDPAALTSASVIEVRIPYLSTR
jgi:hypothetical protein